MMSPTTKEPRECCKHPGAVDDWIGVDMEKTTLCTVIDGQGDECRRPLDEGATISLCYRHYIQAALAVREMRTPEAEKVFGAPDRRVPEPAPQPVKGTWPKVRDQRKGLEDYDRPSVVYYVRFRHDVKIGTTVDLARRLMEIRHDEVLAIEPGGVHVERKRHHEFRADRIDGEWFEASRRLRVHIVRLRHMHGDPLETWQEVAKIAPLANIKANLGLGIQAA